MSLSKPLVNVLSIYLEQLYMHPLRTKSITRLIGIIISLLKFSMLLPNFADSHSLFIFILQCCVSQLCKLCFTKNYGLQRNQSTKYICLCYVWVGSVLFFKCIKIAFEFHHLNCFFFESLLFGGSVPHYANKLGERYLVGRIRINPYLLIFMIERLIFTPIFQVLSLYFLSVFEVCASEINLLRRKL